MGVYFVPVAQNQASLPHPVHYPPLHVWVPDRIPFYLQPLSPPPDLQTRPTPFIFNDKLDIPSLDHTLLLIISLAVWLPPLLTTCKTICLTQPQILEKENPRCFSCVWLQTPCLVGFKKEWDSCHLITDSLFLKRHSIRAQFPRNTIPYPAPYPLAIMSHLKTRLLGLEKKTTQKQKKHRTTNWIWISYKIFFSECMSMQY